MSQQFKQSILATCYCVLINSSRLSSFRPLFRAKQKHQEVPATSEWRMYRNHLSCVGCDANKNNSEKHLKLVFFGPANYRLNEFWFKVIQYLAEECLSSDFLFAFDEAVNTTPNVSLSLFFNSQKAKRLRQQVHREGSLKEVNYGFESGLTPVE